MFYAAWKGECPLYVIHLHGAVFSYYADLSLHTFTRSIRNFPLTNITYFNIYSHSHDKMTVMYFKREAVYCQV